MLALDVWFALPQADRELVLTTLADRVESLLAYAARAEKQGFPTRANYLVGRATLYRTALDALLTAPRPSPLQNKAKTPQGISPPKHNKIDNVQAALDDTKRRAPKRRAK